MSRTPDRGREQVVVAVNGYAVASIVLGVAALVTAFIPLIGVPVGGVLALAGIITGVIGRRRAADEDDPKRQNMGLSTGGIVASGIALFGVLLQIVGIVALEEITPTEFREFVDPLGNRVPAIEEVQEAASEVQEEVQEAASEVQGEAQ